MDKGRVCAWVDGDVEDINRATIKEAFSQFGYITKIFIDEESKYAKVYFNNQESLKLACENLNGFKSWKVKLQKDNYFKPGKTSTNESSINNSFAAQSRLSGGSRTFDFDRLSIGSGSNLEDMEEDCVYAGEYVDVHGNTVDVLQAENGQLFVNLNHAKKSGFNIYRKDSYFKNVVITKDVDLKEFNNYLLTHAKTYLINLRKKCEENEILSVFERVRAKLESSDHAVPFGEGRLINNPQSKNFSITAKSELSPSAPAREGSFQNTNNRSPQQLPANFQPSFSFSQTKKSSHDNRHDRHNGQPPSNDSRGPQNNSTNRNQRNEGALWDRNAEPNQNVNSNSSQVRKPRHNDSGTISRNAEPVVDNNEAEESREAEKPAAVARPSKPTPPAAVSQPKPQNEPSLVNNDRCLLNIDRVILDVGSYDKVKVSYLYPDKKGVFQAQLAEKLNLIDEILLRVNTEDNRLPEIGTPVRDMLCVAFFEECWYRAVVMRYNPSDGVALVDLIDYGNRERISTPLREMSEEMKKIPGQAVRFAVHGHDSNQVNLNVGLDLEVFVKKHYTDLTHLIEIKNILETSNVDDEPKTPPSKVSSDGDFPNEPIPVIAPKEDCFSKVPPCSAKIVSGESVMVVNYTENKVVLRNKEMALICKNVYTHLGKMQKNPISDPKVGQLVLCSKDTDEGLHRAVIKKINGKAAELEYIDFYGGETLSLSSLRNVDKVLASFPSARIEQDYPALAHLTEKSEELLTDLVIQKKKIKTTMDNGNLDFLLIEDDKTVLLSDKIKELAKPPQPKSQEVKQPVVVASPSIISAPAQQEAQAAAPSVDNEEEYIQVNFDTMPYVKAELGLGEYSCFCCKGDSIVIVSVSEKNIEYLNEIDIKEPVDKTPYAPELFAMCLAKFEDVWYRALVTDLEGDVFEVLFVDFGNAENINKSDLRRFPKKLATVPILGINAYFIGIPNTPKVHNRLKELIPEQEVMIVDVKVDINDDDLKYGIEIPSVYDILRKEGLI